MLFLLNTFLGHDITRRSLEKRPITRIPKDIDIFATPFFYENQPITGWTTLYYNHHLDRLDCIKPEYAPSTVIEIFSGFNAGFIIPAPGDTLEIKHSPRCRLRALRPEFMIVGKVLQARRPQDLRDALALLTAYHIETDYMAGVISRAGWTKTLGAYDLVHWLERLGEGQDDYKFLINNIDTRCRPLIDDLELHHLNHTDILYLGTVNNPTSTRTINAVLTADQNLPDGFIARPLRRLAMFVLADTFDASALDLQRYHKREEKALRQLNKRSFRYIKAVQFLVGLAQNAGRNDERLSTINNLLKPCDAPSGSPQWISRIATHWSTPRSTNRPDRSRA